MCIDKLSRNREEQVVRIDVEKDDRQDRSLRNTVFRRRNLLCSKCTGSKCETSVSDSIIILTTFLNGRRLGSLQLRSRCQTMSYCCQMDKYDTGLLLSLKKILDVLCQQNDLLHGWLPASKASLLFRKQWINNWLNSGVDKPLEDLVGKTKKRYRLKTLRVPHRFYRFWDRDYKRCFLDLGNFESAQAGRKKIT